MKTSKLIVLVMALAMVGCARFSTKQTDTRNKDGTTTITTKATSYTLFESKSQLSNFKATQTEKSQSAAVGSLSQEASSTNVVAVLEAVAKIVQSVPK